MPFRILCNAFLVFRMRTVFVLARVPLHVPFSGRAVMFCTNCGKSCVSNAKYCHTCGKHLSESPVKEESTQNEKGQSSGGDAEVKRLQGGVLCSIESTQEEERTKHFTKKNGKRLKLETKGKPSSKGST